MVILAVLAAVNFLANRYDKSYDSTANKQFSLSDQTIKVVKGLKNDVQHHLLRSTDATSPTARDLLDRYSALSPKLHVEYIDPVKKPQQAKAAGYRRDAPVLVTAADQEEGRQGADRRRDHRRADPLAEDRRAQRLLPATAAASTASTTRTARGFSYASRCWSATTTRPGRVAPEAAGAGSRHAEAWGRPRAAAALSKCPRTARCWWSRARRRDYRAAGSRTPSRLTWKAAAAR